MVEAVATQRDLAKPAIETTGNRGPTPLGAHNDSNQCWLRSRRNGKERWQWGGILVSELSGEGSHIYLIPHWRHHQRSQWAVRDSFGGEGGLTVGIWKVWSMAARKKKQTGTALRCLARLALIGWAEEEEREWAERMGGERFEPNPCRGKTEGSSDGNCRRLSEARLAVCHHMTCDARHCRLIEKCHLF